MCYVLVSYIFELIWRNYLSVGLFTDLSVERFIYRSICLFVWFHMTVSTFLVSSADSIPYRVSDDMLPVAKSDQKPLLYFFQFFFSLLFFPLFLPPVAARAPEAPACLTTAIVCVSLRREQHTGRKSIGLIFMEFSKDIVALQHSCPQTVVT